MPREFSVIVGINATKAKIGSRQFKRASDTVVRSSNRMSRGVKRTQKRMTALITTVGRLRGFLTIFATGFLGAGGIFTVIRTLSQFQTSISQVNALLGPQRGTDKIMRLLTARARELGATTVFTATQAAEGMKFLTLAGFDALEVFQAIGPALTLAQAGALGLGEASDIVSNIMAGFDIAAGKVVEVVDALAVVASRTNTNIRQLGEAMKFVAPVARAVGLNVNETAAALGILGNAGLQASLAGTSLRRVLSGLLNPSREAGTVLGNMGLTAQGLVAILSDPEQGLTAVIALLAEKGIDAADAFTLFGQRGAPGLLALVSQVEKLKALNVVIEETNDAALTMAETMTDNIGGDAKIAISALQEAILQLGDAGLTVFLRETTQSFTGFIRGLTGSTLAMEKQSEAMQSGARIGKTLRENLDKLKTTVIILSALLFRKLIAAMVGYGAATLVAIFRSLTLIPLLFETGGAALVASAGLTSLGAAFAFLTGPIGIALAVGAIVAFILSTDDATEAAEKNATALNTMRVAAEQAILTFDKVDIAQKAFKREQISDAVTVIAGEINKANIAVTEYKRAVEALSEAQDTATAAQTAASLAAEAFGATSETARELTQAFLDANLELKKIQETIDNNNILELENNVSALTAEFRVLIESGRSMDEVFASLRTFISEAAEESAILKEEMKSAGEQMVLLTGHTFEEAAALLKLLDKLVPIRKATEKVEESQKLLSKAFAVTNVQEQKLIGNTTDLILAQKELDFQRRKALAVISPLNKALQDNADKNAILAAGTNEVTVRLVKFAIATRDEIIALQLLGASVEEVEAKLRALQDEFLANERALAAQCRKTKELEGCMTDAAKRIDAVWDQALRNIQDAFADAFKGAFDSFGDFAKALLDAMKTLVANLVAELVVSGLIDFFKGGATIKAGSGTGSPVTISPSGLKDILAGGFAGLATGLKDVAKKFVSALKNFGAGFVDFFKTGGAATIGAAGTVGAIAAGALTGLGSGLLADKIFGSRGKESTTATLSAIGGVIGGIFGGPLGAILGGAIGSFVSNLFGGAKKLESATLQFSAAGDQLAGSITTVVSKQRSFFRGKRRTTTVEDLDLSDLQDVLSEVFSGLTAIGEALGGGPDAFSGSTFKRQIDIKGKTEEEIAALIETAFNDTIVVAILGFIKTTASLSDRFKNTVLGFAGDAEEFVRAFEAAAKIDLLFLVDPVKTITDAIAEENKSLTQSYNELLSAYREVLDEFDGSIESLEFLALATGAVITAQLQLVAALKQVSEEIATLFQDSAQFIRESILSDEELFALRKTQIDELVEQASMTTDPAELASLAETINRLGLDAFNLLDEDQRKLLAPEFIEFFEGLEDIFGNQIQIGLDAISADNQMINDEVTSVMLDAANIQNDAAIIFADAVNNFVSGGEEGRAGPGIDEDILHELVA